MTRRILLSAVPAVLLLAACGKETGTAPAGSQAAIEASADQIIYGMRHRVTTEGVRKADLRSDTAFTRPGDPVVRLKRVRLVFFDENGRQTGELTSKTGEYNLGAGTMIARGNAVLALNGPKGPRIIETEELHYEQRADRVWSDKATTMKEAGQTYRGNSFTSDTKFQNVTVQQLTTSGIPTQGSGIRF